MCCPFPFTILLRQVDHFVETGGNIENGGEADSRYCCCDDDDDDAAAAVVVVVDGEGGIKERTLPGEVDAEAGVRQAIGPSLGQVTLRAKPEIVELEEAEDHPASGGITAALSGVWEEPDTVEFLLRGLIGTLSFGPGNNLQMAAHRTLKRVGVPAGCYKMSLLNAIELAWKSAPAVQGPPGFGSDPPSVRGGEGKQGESTPVDAAPEDAAGGAQRTGRDARTA